jgi:hypothetical protein
MNFRRSDFRRSDFRRSDFRRSDFRRSDQSPKIIIQLLRTCEGFDKSAIYSLRRKSDHFIENIIKSKNNRHR